MNRSASVTIREGGVGLPDPVLEADVAFGLTRMTGDGLRVEQDRFRVPPEGRRLTPSVEPRYLGSYGG
ncbi:MAG: hypothetical protein M5U12_33190 [Verrucomicrobia bacterium]|nr:hypothetical protein [Verrucomicrobiota bacterium]